jgi:hypothetical protein
MKLASFEVRAAELSERLADVRRQARNPDVEP